MYNGKQYSRKGEKYKWALLLKNRMSYNYDMEKNIQHLIDEFLTHIEVEKNRSVTTVRNYSHWLKRFNHWATDQDITSPAHITPAAIKRYKTYIAQLPGEKRLQKNTRNYHLIALRSFLAYLARTGISSLPKHKVVLTRTLPREQGAALDASEAQRLLHAVVNTNEANKIKKRDAAILALLLHSDLRVSEAAALLRSDIRLHRKECVSRRKNTYHPQELPSNVCEALRVYLEDRKDSYAPLFIRYDRAAVKTTVRNQRLLSLTPRSIQRIVSRYARLAGIEKEITPETLRRTALMDR